MKHYDSPFQIPPRLRWFVWPTITVSGGGTLCAMLLGEEAVLMTGCPALLLIPGLTTIIFWFNRMVFKAAEPRHEDLSSKNSIDPLHTKKD